MMKLECMVIQFAKFPRLGGVKTRLKPLLEDEGCYQLHLELMQWVNANLHASGIFTFLSLDQLGHHSVIDELAKHNPILLQQGQDLGQKMQHAMRWGLTRAKQVIIVGSDCPQLSTQHLQQVRAGLQDHDHVLIPAEDGGYVLIASSECFAPVYAGIAWGSGQVLEQSKRKLQLGNKKLCLLPELWDVDRPADYRRLLSLYPSWPARLPA
ncbi:MAG: TIGR04282 family arsenosugar biosynthesis glycosyltransferase [Bermanella sp.]